MKRNDNRRLVGLWLPQGLLMNKDLTWTEKILIADIYCFEQYWKSNDSIGELLGIKERQVTVVVSSLVKKGFLTRVLVYDKDKPKQVTGRYLKLTKSAIDLVSGVKNFTGSSRFRTWEAPGFENGTPPRSEKREAPAFENGEEYNIEHNTKNTKENTSPLPPKGELNGKPKTQESVNDVFEEISKGNAELFESLKGWEEMRNKLKKPLTVKAATLAMKKLMKLSGGNQGTMIEIVDQSTMNGWQGLFPLKVDSVSRGGKKEMETVEDLEEWAKAAVPDDIPQGDTAAWLYEIGLIDEYPGGDTGGKENNGHGESHGGDKGGVPEV